MNHRRYHRQSKRRGTVLVLIIVLLLIIVMIAGSIVHLLAMDARQIGRDHDALQAARLAEAGLRRARVQLNANPDYKNETWTPKLPAGPAEIAIKITTQNNTRVINSRATFPSDSQTPVRVTREAATN